jgi:hypothetical protein
MSDSRPENDCELIIDSAVLADIQRQCRARRAEMEAAGTLPPATIAPGAPQSAFAALPARLLSRHFRTAFGKACCTCRQTWRGFSKPRSLSFHRDNRRAPRTGSSANRVLDSVAGAVASAATKAAVTSSIGCPVWSIDCSPNRFLG